MFWLIVAFVVSLFDFFVGGVSVCNKSEDPGGFVIAILGVVFLVLSTFFVAPMTLHTGSPAVSINAGEHQVVFVYIAGDNVNVGVEKEDQRFGEGHHLFLYQFSRSAFEGEIKENAKKLVVVESGEFKKLRLE